MMLYDEKDLIGAVERYGFLPFFSHGVKGFSVEDMTPRELWFNPEKDGPWEWKGPAAFSKTCAYGKFFHNKAGFVSLEWLPDFANMRRDGYDFDARWDDGKARAAEKDVYDVLLRAGSMLSRDLKEASGFGKDGRTGFDGVITRLQMQTYVTVANFEYDVDRHGKPYGWGVARYCLPEIHLGEEALTSAYRTDPAVSRAKIIGHLVSVWDKMTEKEAEFLIR